MGLDPDKSNSTYGCREAACTFHWRRQEGYFHERDGIMAYPPNTQQLLRPALVREHGYLYIALIADGTPPRRTWKCAVKDCPNMIVEDSEFEMPE
jgi:hypothetical protein